MKKIMIIACVLVLGTAHAQTVWGIRGGVNINDISNSYTGGIDQADNLQSYHAGLMTNISVFMFSFQPSVLVTGKGALATYGDPNGTADYFVAETNPLYLEIPATFNLNLHFGDFSGVYVGAGPYFAWGIGGTNRVHGRREGTEFGSKTKIEFKDEAPVATSPAEGGAYSVFRKTDYGATINAGVFLTNLHIGVFYDHGLATVNVISNSDQQDKLHLRTIGFTAGFVFGRK